MSDPIQTRKIMPEQTKSIDFKADEAIAELDKLDSAEEATAFVEGDERKSVLDAFQTKFPEQVEESEPDLQTIVNTVVPALDAKRKKHKQARGSMKPDKVDRDFENAVAVLKEYASE